MTDPKKNQDEKIDRQDEISRSAEDDKHMNDHYVDALKTGNQKQKRYFDKPFDEQMYDSFDDIKDQQGEQNEESN